MQLKLLHAFGCMRVSLRKITVKVFGNQKILDNDRTSHLFVLNMKGESYILFLVCNSIPTRTLNVILDYLADNWHILYWFSTDYPGLFVQTYSVINQLIKGATIY